MSALLEFLAANDVSDITEEVKVSNRFPEKFKIKALTQSKFNEIQKKCQSRVNKDGASFDTGKFNMNCILEGCVYPNFSDVGFVNTLKASTPTEAITKCMLPGEITDLAKAILSLSGFDDDINDDIEEAKN